MSLQQHGVDQEQYKRQADLDGGGEPAKLGQCVSTVNHYGIAQETDGADRG
jgi:hypothetical protein